MAHRTWLTVRLDGDTLTAQAVASGDTTAADDSVHTVTESVPVELPPETATALSAALAAAEKPLAKKLFITTRRHMAAVDATLERRVRGSDVSQ